MAQLKLQIHDVDEAGKDYTFQLERAWLDEVLADAGLRADAASAPGSIELHIQKNGNEYLVNGQLDAELITDCCRCLGDAHVPAHVAFAVLFHRSNDKPVGKAAIKAKAHKAHDDKRAASDPKHARKAKPDEDDDVIEGEDDELQREPFSGHEIVLDPFIREQLVLECPMQPLCSEDCAGIPVPEHIRPPADVFGNPDNDVQPVDPRLAPLLRLRDKVPPDEAAEAGQAKTNQDRRKRS